MLEETHNEQSTDTTQPEPKPLPPIIMLTPSQYRSLNNAIDEAQESKNKLDEANKFIDETIAGIESEKGLDKGTLATGYSYNRKEFFRP